MNMAGYERLMRDHAYWADQHRHLKKRGMDEIERCPRLYADSLHMIRGGNCIERAITTLDEMRRDNGGEPYTFEEVWQEMIAGDEVCEHCQEVRRLKAERVAASRRLGAVRAAMTRVGRGLTMNEEHPHD